MPNVGTEFRAAVRAVDADRVRGLLAANPELHDSLNDSVFDFGATALVYASSSQDKDLMEVLIEAGADVDARSDWDAGPFSALHHQIGGQAQPKPELAQYLIGKGATIDLHSAAGLGRTDLLATYLEADPTRINEPGPDGTTPLHLALNIETAQWLLDHGAPLEQRCIDHGSTPAMWAIAERTDVMRFLVESGATPDLFMAAVLNDTDLAASILDAGPPSIRSTTREGRFAHPPDGGDGYIWKLDFTETPHEVARLRGNEEVYGYLMDRSPSDIRIVQLAREGDLVELRGALEVEPGIIALMPAQLHWHLMCQKPEVVEIALAFGADPNVRNRDGVTPLHQAAWQGELDKVRFLATHGSDPAIRDTNHASTPLGWAMHNAQQEVVEYLAEHTELDLIDAIVLGRSDSAIVLLGRDPDLAHGTPGATPLRAAAYMGDLEVVRRLLELGVDSSSRNPETGHTALDMARAQGHDAVVAALESVDGA